MSAIARRLSSSCTRAVASSSSASPSSSLPLPRRIYTLHPRPLLLASSSSSPCASPQRPLPLPAAVPPRCSFVRTLATTKGASPAPPPSDVVSPSGQPRRKAQGEEMTITSSVKLSGGTLSVCGRTMLSGVPDAVVASSAAAGGAVDGVFIGADFAEPAARHVVSLGALRGVRFLACFRFKLWWMAQRMGERGGDVPLETQFLLVEPAGGDERPRLSRLTGIKENSKFQNANDPVAGIKTVVRAAMEQYGLKYVYVWHAITGYLGGVLPGAAGTEQYHSSLQFPKVSPGVVENEPGMKTDVLTLQGLGLVHPRAVYRFYDELPSPPPVSTASRWTCSVSSRRSAPAMADASSSPGSTNRRSTPPSPRTSRRTASSPA